MRDVIKIDTEFIKLQDLLKFSGLCETGGQAKVCIQNGDVLVNDEICTMRGKKMRNGDTAKIGNDEVKVISTVSGE
jgi:ribosome-associated protein